MERRLYYFCMAVVALGLIVLGARLSKSWEVSEMNRVVNQSNFVLGGCSGTLISVKHRLILTAYHCIDSDIRFVEEDKVVNGEAKKIRREVRGEVQVEQRFYDGSSKVGSSTFQATIVAYSKAHDLAILQMKQKDIPQTLDIPVLPFGKEVMRGEAIWLVGNPAGLDATVTTGVVSSITREAVGQDGNRVSMLQTDAAGYFGSSGGAMVNKDGKLIGVTSRGIPGSVILTIHYKHVQQLLDDACYGEAWKPDSDTFEVCTEKKEAAKKAVK